MATGARPAEAADRILVCLDGSPRGEAGLGYGLAIARGSGAELVLLDVIDSTPHAPPRPVDTLWIEAARSNAARYLEELANRVSGEEFVLTPLIAEGRPPDEILAVADKLDVGLIILTAHGTRAETRFHLGVTAQRVSQHARHSLLLVHAHDQAEAPLQRSIERILVLLDGSAAAESALPTALQLSRNLGAEIILAHAIVHAVLPTCEPLARQDRDLIAQLYRRSTELARAYLRKVERTLRDEGAYCRSVIKEGDSIRQTVLSLAEDEAVDLIILTSHGHTSNGRVNHGGVTQQILTHTDRPVWVVQNLRVAREQRETTAATRVPSERLRVHVDSRS